MRISFLILSFCFACSAFAQVKVKAKIPSVLRTGDYIEIPVSLENTIEKETNGQIQLLLLNANTKTSVDGWMQNVFPVQHYSAAAHSTQTLSFPIRVPMELDFHELAFVAVTDSDTIQLAKTDIIGSFAEKKSNIKISHFFSKIHNGEVMSLHEGEEASVGDTVILKIHAVTDKKSFPGSISINPSSNISMMSEGKTFRKMNIIIKEQRFIVEYAGSCTGSFSVSTNKGSVISESYKISSSAR